MAITPVSFVSAKGAPLYGVLHAVESEPSATAIVILSPGIKNRVAPHRLYVKMARRFEALGYDVLRFDPEGLGDSGGEIRLETAAELYGSIQRGRFAADTRAALDWMRTERGTQQFVLSGLCGGAITGLHAGQDDARVIGLLGLGIPVILDGIDVDKRRHVTDGQLAGLRKGYVKRVFRLESVVRLITFRSDIRLIWKALTQPLKGSKRPAAPVPANGSNVNPTFAPAYDRFLTGGRKMLLVFSESDRLYWEYKEKFEAQNHAMIERHASASRVHMTPEANHIFTFREWQEDMLNAAVSWLNENFPTALTAAAQEGPPMSVDSQAIVRSFGWVALANYANKGLGFVTTLILARVLAPEDFGTVAVAAMVIEILYLCKDLGISQAIIYRKGDPKEAVSTGVILVTSVNLGLFALAWIAAPFVARFYEHESLTAVIVLLSSNLVWQGLTSVPESLLRKKIDFRALVIPNVVPVVIASALGIALALTGWGVWSLVIRTLTNSVLNMVLIWMYSPFKFEWRYDRRVGRELFGYGKHIVVASAFLISLYNVDRFFVSRFAGVAALGVYTLAMRIALMPVSELSHLVCRVMFPVLSACNDDPERLRSVFLRTVRYSNVVTIPMSMGLAVFGPSLVLAVYGEKWAAMTLPLQLLSAYAFCRSVSSLLHETFKAVGRPELVQGFVLVRLVLIVALGVPALTWLNLAGMCLLLVVVYAAVGLLELEAARRMLSLSFGSVTQCFVVPAIISCVLIPGGYGLLWAAGWDHRLPVLLAAVAVVMALYLVGLAQFERKVIDDVRRMVGNRKARTVIG